MAKDYSWMDKTKGGKRTSAYSSSETIAREKKKKKKKSNSVLGGVSADAKKNMKDSEVGFGVKGSKKREYLDSL